MFNTIAGKITAVDDYCVTVETGNIGFAVMVPSTAPCIIGNSTKLFVHMHWNAEQGPSLYGFGTELDKMVFLLIISCAGIGPKIALTALGQLGSAAFVQAIEQGNEKVLSSISGIGAKKAEQMIVHLKHKVAKLIKTGVQFEGAEHIMDLQNVSEVLVSLNYSRQEITDTLSWLKEQNKGIEISFDKLVRQALSFLAKKA